MKPDTPEHLAFELELPDRPEKVWRALTIPALRDRWLPPRAKTPADTTKDKRPGEVGRVEITVLDAEPCRRLSWRWQEEAGETGIVTFTLAPRADGGTSLSLLHERRITALLMPAAANGNVAMARAA